MTGSPRHAAIAAIVIGLGALVVPASAQITTASVAGNVHDGQGSVIPGAAVTLVSIEQQ